MIYMGCNLNGDVVKSTLKLGHGSVVTSYSLTQMWLLIHVIDCQLCTGNSIPYPNECYYELIIIHNHDEYWSITLNFFGRIIFGYDDMQFILYHLYHMIMSLNEKNSLIQQELFYSKQNTVKQWYTLLIYSFFTLLH